MTGIRTNQIADDAVTAAKIAELTAKIQYNTLTAEGAFSDNRDIVSKKYVDDQILANIEGLDVKQSARACSTENQQAAFSGAGVGAYLESFDPNYGELTTDGVALANGDSVLVKDQGGAIFDTSPWAAMGVDYKFTDTTEFGKYFHFVAPDLAEYYVWFDNGSVGDPALAPTPANQPNAGATGIAADVSAAVTADDVATAIKTAVDAASVSGLTVVRHGARLWFVWTTETTGNDNSAITDGNSAGSVVSAPLSVALSTTLVGDPDAVVGRRNGIYIYRDTATATRPWRLTRRTDFDENSEVTANAFLWISEGTSCADTGWVIISDDPLVVDTDGLAFAQFNGAGSITAGDALQKTGNTLDVLYDNTTIGLGGSNQLLVLDGGLTPVKLDDGPFVAEVDGGFWQEDSPWRVSYLNTIAANRKPQFGASVATTGTITGTFQTGETVAFSPSGATGIMLGFDNPFTPTQLYYLPTNSTTPAAADMITGGTSGATIAVNATPNNQRANTPDGSTTTFDLSTSSYNAGEAPALVPEVVASALQVWRNGILQKKNAIEGQGAYHTTGAADYYEMTNTLGVIEFAIAPAYGDEITARYAVRLDIPE